MNNIALEIINKFGGITPVATLLGVHRSTIYRWTICREKGGTGGIIPTRHQSILLIKSKAMGIDLKPSDFFDLNVNAIKGNHTTIIQQNHVEQGA